MTTSPTATSAVSATDPRPTLLRAADQLTPYVERVSPDLLDAPTPCADWTVRDLLAHLVAVERRIAHIVRGGHPLDLPSQVTDVADDGWMSAWAAGRADLAAALDEPDVLGRTIQHPRGAFPAPQALLAYVSELTAHGWDLAAALGDTSDLDQSLAAACLGPIHGLLPAEGRDAPGFPFGPVVEVDDEAPAYDRLMGWYGRDPRWVPGRTG